jgi:hypothetical protein
MTKASGQVVKCILDFLQQQRDGGQIDRWKRTSPYHASSESFAILGLPLGHVGVHHGLPLPVKDGLHGNALGVALGSHGHENLDGERLADLDLADHL